MKTKQLLINLLIFFLAFITILIILELALRIIYFPQRFSFGGPGIIKFIHSTKFNNFHFRQNNDIQIIKTKPVRIAILGDSVTLGQGIVDINKTWPAILVNYLGKDKVEVINASWTGLDTEMEAKIYQYRLRQLSPDIVIISFFVNDAKTNEVITDEVDYYSQLLKRNYLNDFSRFLFGVVLSDNSYLFNFIIIQLEKIRTRFGSSFVDKLQTIYQDEAQLTLYRQLLEDLFAQMRRDGVTPIIIINPLFYQFDRYPLTQAHTFIKKIAQDNKVGYLDLLDVFKNKNYQDYIVNSNDFHPNEKAHELIAKSVANFLIDEAVLEQN